MEKPNLSDQKSVLVGASLNEELLDVGLGQQDFMGCLNWNEGLGQCTVWSIPCQCCFEGRRRARASLRRLLLVAIPGVPASRPAQLWSVQKKPL